MLDVGCGIGGTSRYLSSALGCTVTGITISSKQVEIATRLTKAAAAKESSDGADAEDSDGLLKLGKGKVRFIELDAEKMGEFFASEAEQFDAVWISEALSHFPNKPLFFQNAEKVLKKGGKLVLADWFKAENLGEKEFENDIKPIEGESVPSGRSQPGGIWISLVHKADRTRRYASAASLYHSGVRRSRDNSRIDSVRRPEGYKQGRQQDMVSALTLSYKISLRVANRDLPGIYRGRWFKTRLSGHSHSAKAEMALPFCRHSGQ